jgi:UDP-glucose 4-epimerase
MELKQKTVLITGVAGLIGSRLADWIIENQPEYKVIGIDDLSGGYDSNVNRKVEFHQIDINDHYRLDKVFSYHKPTYVFHFAAYAAEGLSPFIRKYNYTNNLTATAAIVNKCIQYDTKRLVFTSTMAVYGYGNPPFQEKHQQSPIDPYGIAKYACEMDIKVAGEQHGLDWCIIRPHNVYGIKQNIWDKYRNVLGIWMYQHLNGKPTTIFGDGNQTRAFSFIDDCLEPLWKAATIDKASKQIINLGGTKECTIKEANDTLKKVIGSGETLHLEPRHEVKHTAVSYAKSVSILGYEDKTSLEDGLRIMWEWAKEQPMREQKVWNEYELEKGIYSFWK